MSEQEDLIKLIEITANGLKDIQSNIKTIHEQGTKHIQDLEEKQTTIRRLNERIQELESQATALEAEKEALSAEKNALEADLRQQLQSLETEKVSLFTEKDSLAGELQRKAAEYDNLLRQFENISSEFKSLREKEEVSLDVQQLLSLYVALVEDIYAARPHIRILWLLHGAKGITGMSRDEVTKASGFEPIAVLSAIHDLANSGFLGYNVETQLITLERRIFD